MASRLDDDEVGFPDEARADSRACDCERRFIENLADNLTMINPERASVSSGCRVSAAGQPTRVRCLLRALYFMTRQEGCAVASPRARGPAR